MNFFASIWFFLHLNKVPFWYEWSSHSLTMIYFIFWILFFFLFQIMDDYLSPCKFGLSKSQLITFSPAIAGYIIVSFVTVFGNLLIIAAILTEPRLRNNITNHYYIRWGQFSDCLMVTSLIFLKIKYEKIYIQKFKTHMWFQQPTMSLINTFTRWNDELEIDKRLSKF